MYVLCGKRKKKLSWLEPTSETSIFPKPDASYIKFSSDAY